MTIFNQNITGNEVLFDFLGLAIFLYWYNEVW